MYTLYLGTYYYTEYTNLKKKLFSTIVERQMYKKNHNSLDAFKYFDNFYLITQLNQFFSILSILYRLIL